MSLEVPRIFWPVVIDSTNDGLSFAAKTAMSGAQFTYAGTIANATYTDPESLLSAITSAIGAATRGGPVAFSADGGGATSSITTSGVVTVSLTGVTGTAGSTQRLNWTTGEMPLIGALLGYDVSAADSVDAVATVSAFPADYQMQHFWTPGYPVETDTGSGSTDFDTGYIATVSTNAAGQQVSTLWTGTPTYERNITIGLLPKEKIWTNGESTSVNQAFERCLVGGYAKLRYWPDRATLGTYADYFLREQAFADFKGIASTRFSSAVERYRLTLALGRYVA